MVSTSARWLRRLAVACALATTLAAVPVVAYADDAEALADTIESELATADEVQDAVDAAATDPTAENIDAAATALSTDEPAPSYTFSNVNSRASYQLLFAQLQIQLGLQAKQNAAQKIEEVQALQQQQAECANVISELRQLLNAGGGELSSDLASRIEALGVSATAGSVTTSQIESLLDLLESKQDDIESNTQQKMVYVQDYIDQYNSYLQNSQSSVTEVSELLNALSRGTVDESDIASSTIDDLAALVSSIDEQIEAKRTELEEALAEQTDGGVSTDVKDLFDQYDSLVEQQSLVSEQLASTLSSAEASGTTEGATGDAFGMAALGAGAGAVVGAGACYAVMRRRAGARGEVA